ncbi:immune inhibitor A [Nocardioides KLBMP 9356]|uniref:Immune inhibitor A n=1 Tax=Nocardioides potassii TaxID=2911371 RepID=A0ABS9HEF2_9ACTN|nr:PKD domain-containing protein [Nocardioides potassii]MCF6378486.1 immune inhibitor A [Nocardioides potassii]
MTASHRIAARRTTAAATALLAGLLTVTTVTSGSATASPAPAAAAAPATRAVVSEGVVGGLEVENSFVSAVGWVKPGETYPSRIIVRNTSQLPVTGASVVVAAPVGSTILKAGTTTVNGPSYTWSVGSLAAGASRTLVLESEAATTQQLSTIVWRDLSTTATVTVGGASEALTSHGPKVIPPGSEYDTARYGDRPFPVVPVAYTDRGYGTHDRSLDTVINDPTYEGSTFNLFQEMSLGQLYPHGTVPSTGITTAGFDYPGANTLTGGGKPFPFTKVVPGQTCAGFTNEDLPAAPLYTQRIKNGVYQLPGTTGYYGSDANGSAVIGSLAGVGALQQIDSGCGPTGKIVVDAAAIADPEIDYSDYDTDKDGVVDFFMAVFAGCGGNGASQLSVAGCDLPNPTTGLPDAPYDNIWPHSSSLEFYYTDPRTGLPGFTTDDQLKDLEGRPLWYTDDSYSTMTTTDKGDQLKVFVRVGPYNLNPETAIDHASVISHEYGHSLGLPDFYSTGSRETYGDWNLMATDKSHNIDAFGRQELGWVVPEVLDSDRTETGITDSKQDTDTITWQTPTGTPYTLTEGQGGVGRVQNSQMYVAKLPGRVLLDPAKFDTGDRATASHTWWSRSGNDFGCSTDDGGHNFDLAIPEAASLPAGTTLSLDMKSMWDIEWDFDYGFVLTSEDGGKDFTSHPSANGYTTSNTDPLAGNPNQNGCQAAYDNGITGTSGSYDAGTEATDRKLGNTPDMVFLADRYDISDLVGAEAPVLRFSYATDPGLARPGWFIDDVAITATLPDGSTREIYATDFETSGTTEDPRVFNGGCRADGPGTCGQGWQYVAGGAEGPSDHAYYMEMRDRSGFDLDGNGQADRGAPEFASGFYTSYTDEAHGYGNAGTDDPPAQSPLDSQPEPGSDTPDLNDAAWTDAADDSHFSDGGDGWTDNYADPSSTSGNWEFDYDCLTFDVLDMTGNGDGTVAGEGPQASDGDLTGDVRFDMGAGCADFDYGYGDEPVPPANTAPDAMATATPTTGTPGTKVTLDASGSTDAETPDGLTFSWDFGNGGSTKDATGAVVTHTYGNPGTYDATVTVSDAAGLTDTATVRITITQPGQPTPTPTTTPTPGTGSGSGAGADQASVTVASAAPATLTRALPCQGRSVGHLGSWRVMQGDAPGGSYCDNRGKRPGRDVLRVGFQGDAVDVVFGTAKRGGRAVLFVDGTRVGTVSFAGRRTSPRLDRHAVVSGLGTDRPHRLRLVVKRGTAYVEGFRVAR